MKHADSAEKRLPERLTGPISVNGRGIGYFRLPEPDNDKVVEIDTPHLKTALHNDEVQIIVHKTPQRRPRPQFGGKNGNGTGTNGNGNGRATKEAEFTGEVVKIVQRNKMKFVGTVQEFKGKLFIVPDDRRMYSDIIIMPGKSMGAAIGDKVFVHITEWADPLKNPEGEVIEIIGRKGEHDAEMRSIVLESGFEIDFPHEVEQEAEAVAAEERARLDEEIKLRRDFRDTTTFTIDPADAKDFDDALSVKKLPAKNGKAMYEIGVHIADVSHYVREGTALDKEARKRGLSVYLVDRTIPMLPEVLSNDLCSLNPHVPRLAFSAVFEMDIDGGIHSQWFGKTIINSDKRFTYEAAQQVLDDGAGEYHEELVVLNTIGKKLQAEKFAQGAIDFETEEVKFRLDEHGVPIEVYRKQRLDTHKLIEEFMLLANRKVAEFVFKANEKKGAAFVYRIHDLPNPDKIADLSIFLKALGYELKSGKNGEVTSKEINSLLKRIEGSPHESLIKTAAIRSMAKAVYSTKNIGHFGLAFEYYTHFTSPIRRYPDLMVHRLLQRELTGGKIQPNEFATFERLCADASDKEINAAEAERGSVKYKQVEYMSKHIGETFEGTISGLAEWGIYVEEEHTKCEGMVRLRDLGDDFYVLDKKNYAIVGENTGTRYTLGDKVKFKVMKADLEKKALDYSFV